MRVAILSLSAVAAAAVAVPVPAQTAEPSIDSYLCTFAGKCGASQQPEVTREAPATKGFRIARSPNRQAATPVVAPRPYASSRAPVAMSVPARDRPRAYIASPRAEIAAGIAQPRADLMIAFELGSDRMTGPGVAKARIFAKSLLLPELARKRFLIEGHTDSLGSTDANRDLSQRRAEAVAAFLAGQGVGRDRLEVKGLGSSEPLGGHRASDPINRRVEAELIS